MSVTLKLKQSSTPGAIPLLGDLSFGEVAINTYDAKLYGRIDNGVDQVVLLNTVPTGLEYITEGGSSGWRLIGANSDNYGDIGHKAVDFSQSDAASTTRGASGSYSMAFGSNLAVTGNGSLGGGIGGTNQGQGCVNIGMGNWISNVTGSAAFGGSNEMHGQGGFVCGWGNEVTQNYGFASGYYTKALGVRSTSMGHNGRASGTNSMNVNGTTYATGESSFASGYRTVAEGYASHSGGTGTQPSHNFIVRGRASFGHQEVTASLYDINANNSAILGGKNNTNTVTAERSVILGGTEQVATQADTVYLHQIKFKGRGTDPTGVESGTLYYNSSSETLRLYTSSGWKTLATI